MTASALPEIMLTPAEEDTPDVSFHTKHDFSDRGGSGGSLRRRPNLTPISINLLAFYHECRSLIDYATRYLFCDRQ